jgi:hypothetical protein
VHISDEARQTEYVTALSHAWGDWVRKTNWAGCILRNRRGQDLQNIIPVKMLIGVHGLCPGSCKLSYAECNSFVGALSEKRDWHIGRGPSSQLRDLHLIMTLAVNVPVQKQQSAYL